MFFPSCVCVHSHLSPITRVNFFRQAPNIKLYHTHDGDYTCSRNAVRRQPSVLSGTASQDRAERHANRTDHRQANVKRPVGTCVYDGDKKQVETHISKAVQSLIAS